MKRLRKLFVTGLLSCCRLWRQFIFCFFVQHFRRPFQRSAADCLRQTPAWGRCRLYSFASLAYRFPGYKHYRQENYRFPGEDDWQSAGHELGLQRPQTGCRCLLSRSNQRFSAGCNGGISPQRYLVIGFVTGISSGEVQRKTEHEVLNIFIPTTPNPTSGFLIFCAQTGRYLFWR